MHRYIAPAIAIVKNLPVATVFFSGSHTHIYRYILTAAGCKEIDRETDIRERERERER